MSKRILQILMNSYGAVLLSRKEYNYTAGQSHPATLHKLQQVNSYCNPKHMICLNCHPPLLVQKIDIILRNFAPFTLDVRMRSLENLEISAVKLASVCTRLDVVRSSCINHLMQHLLSTTYPKFFKIDIKKTFQKKFIAVNALLRGKHSNLNLT